MRPDKQGVSEIEDFECRSFDGYVFYFLSSRWKINRQVSISFRVIEKIFDAALVFSYRKVILHFAERYSAYSVQTLHCTFMRFCRKYSNGIIDCSMVISYKEELSPEAEDDLAFIKAILRVWVKLELPGVDPQVISMVEGWRLRRAPKGDAVKRLHPTDGPLTDIELQALIEGMARAYENGKISLTQMAIFMVLQSTGRRPIQITGLRLKDLSRVAIKSGGERYFLDVPRAKQQGTQFRGVFRKVELTRDNWNVLSAQKDLVINDLKKIIKEEIEDDLLLELPLFYRSSVLAKLKSLDDLIEASKTDSLHMPYDVFRELFNDAGKKASVISERTGKPLAVTARRLRYTLGTRAAREGFGVLIIAELLDHSNTDNAHIYTLNVPEHAAHIEHAVGELLSPYATAFAGQVLSMTDPSSLSCDRQRHIRSVDGKAAGACGQGGPCGASVPVPCYTCHHFRAWVDGPHQKLYDSLLAERAEVMKTTNDATMTSVLDRTIMAIGEVIMACQQYRNKDGADNE